ncbi:MAG: ABC transporter substrate-binding protein [Chloroflexota bacterium]|nr:MAG: ABC transporter substrate-binding protein [Chloroflexota bacterium]
MSRKLFQFLSVVILISMLMVACGGPATEAPAEPGEPAVEEPAAGEDVINIGFISAFTGVFSSFGTMQREGAELALDEYGYEVAGKKINVIYEDDQLDNEQAVTKAKKLVEQDNVDILTGLVSGDEGLTVGDYMKDKGIPVIPMYSASEDMTMRSFFPTVVRATWTGAQAQDPFGYYLAQELGYKKLYQIGEDYSFPWNESGGLIRGFCRGGGEEVTSVWFPPGSTSDFSSMIASIPLDQGYDAVYYNGAGGDAVNFVKQFVELGMLDKIALVGQSNTFEKPDLDSLPKDIVGALSAHHTTDDLARDEWVAFSEAFNAKWGHDPSGASAFAYTSMKMILEAIKALDGDVSDKDALVQAMLNVDMTNDPRGPVVMDPTWHAAVENVYIREVALDEDGNLYNKGILAIENVSQFGPYDSELYMAQTPDGNSYPSGVCAELPPEMLEGGGYEYLPMGD